MSDTPGNMEITFDMSHSAAVLALQHFSPQVRLRYLVFFVTAHEHPLSWQAARCSR